MPYSITSDQKLLGWGDSGNHASSGAAKREPPWHQPRDGRVPPHPATLIPLSRPRMRQGAITLSAPCSAFPSLRWTNAIVMLLLCACVGLMDRTSSLGFMNCTRCSGCLILFWLIFPELGLLRSFPFACCCSLLVASALLIFQRCPGREGSPNEVRHDIPANHVWPSAPHLHPPTVHLPRHLPRPPP